MISALWVLIIYLLPGLAGVLFGPSLEMYGSVRLARVVMTLCWPIMLLILPLRMKP